MTYAMTLDHSWEIMSEEEMYDVNGGIYLSKAEAAMAIAYTGMSPGSFIIAVGSVVLVKNLISFLAKTFGSIWGWVAAAAAGFVAKQFTTIGFGVARGAINNGVTFGFNLNFLIGDFGVVATVHV